MPSHQFPSLEKKLKRKLKKNSGADVSLKGPSANPSPSPSADTDAGDGDANLAHRTWLQSFVAFNLNITHAFSTHPKILVVGLNGPVIGLSAALCGFADFVYAVPSAFLLTPFSSLGLVAEGGASCALVRRLGLPKANEALIMSKRLGCDELLATGFVNKVFADCARGEHDKFRARVLAEIDDRLGDHLVGDSLLGIKALIRRPERELLERQNVAEVFAGLDRFVSGVPQQEFFKIATGKKKHKL